MVGRRQQVRRDLSFESKLGLQGCFRPVRESDAVRDPEYVGIDGHHLLLPDHGAHDIGRLASHAGQTLQLLQVARHFAAELLAEHAGHARQVFRLVVGIGDALDVGIDLLGSRGSHSLRCRESLEQGRRSHIDPLVRALGRQDHGHQQLIRRAVRKLALGDGHVLLEPRDHPRITLLQSHCLSVLSRNPSGGFPIIWSVWRIWPAGFSPRIRKIRPPACDPTPGFRCGG